MWDPAYTEIILPPPPSEKEWEEALAKFSKKKWWLYSVVSFCSIVILSIALKFIIQYLNQNIIPSENDPLFAIAPITFFIFATALLYMDSIQTEANTRTIAKHFGWSYLMSGYPDHGLDLQQKYPRIFRSYRGLGAVTTNNEWWGRLVYKNELESLNFWMAQATITYPNNLTASFGVCAFQLRRPAQTSFSITPELIKARQISYWNDTNFESPDFNKSFRLHADKASETFTTLNPVALQFLLDIKKVIGEFSLHVDKDVAFLVSSPFNTRNFLPQSDSLELRKNSKTLSIKISKLERMATAISSFAHSVD